jgi:hypothetical protein
VRNAIVPTRAGMVTSALHCEAIPYARQRTVTLSGSCAKAI